MPTRCTPEEVKAAFWPSFGEDDEKIVNECISICQNFNLSPEDLRWKLEAQNFNSLAKNSEISSVTLDLILDLKVQMQRELTKEKKVQPRKSAVSANVNRVRVPAAINRGVIAPAIPGRSVVARVKREEVQVAGPSHVVFSGLEQDEEAKKKRAYRYMFEKPMERSENLDQIIDDDAELVKNHYKLDDIADPGTTTDDDVVIVGRIYQDVEVDSTKLTEASVFIESSRMLSSGSQIALKFDSALVIRNNVRGARGLGLFPGAITAMKGRNGGGGYFLVKEILTLPVPNATSSIPNVNTIKIDAPDPSPFSLAIVCGPFTADSDLNYAPLASVLETLRQDKPSAILLIGPFIDAAHSSIKAGDVNSKPTKLFDRKVYKPLCTFLDASPGSVAILLPGIRDLVSNHAVYPQSELSTDLVNNDPRVHLVPNPARFKLNDIYFSASSVDVLFHLRREEFMKSGREVDPAMPLHEDDVGTDAMANLCRHLLQQRSFYPIFPTPLDLAREVNLDITHYDGLKLVDAENPNPPDVLILPSKLKQFVKTVHNTTVINPSFLNRGTYVLLKVAEGGDRTYVKQRLSYEIARLSG